MMGNVVLALFVVGPLILAIVGLATRSPAAVAVSAATLTLAAGFAALLT